MARPFLLTLSLVIACLLCGCSRPQPGWPYYTLALNGEPTGQGSQFAPDDLGVCVYVNGNPVGIYPRANSIAIPVNQYLRPGTNQITVTDSAKRSWYMGMSRVSKDDQTVLVDTNFIATDQPFVVTLNLPNVPWSLPLFDSTIAGKDISTNEILQFVQRLFAFTSATDDTNKAAALALMENDGLDVWQPTAYGMTDEVLATERSTARYNMDKVDSFIELPGPDKLKIIPGPNAIVIYTGISGEKPHEKAWIARVRLKDGSEVMTPELVLYRKNATWAVWQ
ncbi:MAG TPA: hypothetical protein VMH87_03980 [Pseudomonadales bacterium]|nr:hypothetical protein [Pseudomonadales bacterium]